MGFFGDIGGFLSKAVDVASMIPGPHQPFALAGSAIKRLPGIGGGGGQPDTAQFANDFGQQQGMINVPNVRPTQQSTFDLMQSRMGGGSTGDKLKDFLLSEKGAALGVGLMGLLDQRKRRKSQERFNQQRLDALVAALGRGEKQSEALNPAREASLEALLGGLGRKDFLNDQIR